MDITSLVMFFGGGSLVAALVTGILKKVLGGVSDRYGSLASQVVLFVVSLAIASLMTASALLPHQVVLITVGIFLTAMGIYEVLYKAVWQQAIQGKV